MSKKIRLYILIFSFLISSFSLPAQIDRRKGETTKPTNASNNTTDQTAGAITKTTLAVGVEMSFAYVPPGEFKMGSNSAPDEKPIHAVKISQGFSMQATEVTQAQWKAVMGSLPSKCDSGSLSENFLGDNKPVICVSWDDAQEFIKRMNLKKDGFKYRLPTEAEWEYAARQDISDFLHRVQLGKIAWYSYNSGRLLIRAPEVLWNNDPSAFAQEISRNGNSIQAVATKQANSVGLYDMRGNVWEWVQDWYHAGYYAESPASDPAGPAQGSSKVIRGASWFNLAEDVRIANRHNSQPSSRSYTIGFRLLRVK